MKKIQFACWNTLQIHSNGMIMFNQFACQIVSIQKELVTQPRVWNYWNVNFLIFGPPTFTLTVDRPLWPYCLILGENISPNPDKLQTSAMVFSKNSKLFQQNPIIVAISPILIAICKSAVANKIRHLIWDHFVVLKPVRLWSALVLVAMELLVISGRLSNFYFFLIGWPDSVSDWLLYE